MLNYLVKNETFVNNSHNIFNKMLFNKYINPNFAAITKKWVLPL